MGEYMPTSAPTRAQTWFLQPPKVTAGCLKVRSESEQRQGGAARNDKMRFWMLGGRGKNSRQGEKQALGRRCWVDSEEPRATKLEK